MTDPETPTTYGDYQPSLNDIGVENEPADAPQDAPESPSGQHPPEGAPSESTAIAATGSGGAPLANMNHFGSGLNSDPAIGQLRLKMGSLPPSLLRVERAANQFRRALENAVELAHGRVDMVAALAINTAARWERHSLLALRWLRDHHATMDDADRLRYSKEIAKASAERDKAVTQLRLSAADRKTIEGEICTPPA